MSDVETCGCSRVVISRKHPGYEAHECADCGARFMRAALWNPAREQTAATLMAAMIAGDGIDVYTDHGRANAAATAVAATDALRAELAKGGG